MSAESLLSRLAKVRKINADQWMACCPAHADKSPSLSIRELSDGRILLHCWTGCSAESILDSIGLTFDDLFPERLPDISYPRVKPTFSAREVLVAMQPELLTVALIGRQMADGIPNDEKTQQALITAVSRIASAHAYAEGL